MRQAKRSLVTYKVKKYIKYSILLVLTAIWLLPVYGMFSIAFRPRYDMYGNFFIPSSITLENFVEAYNYGAFSAIKNSVIYTTGGIALALALSVLAAYGFSRFHIRGKNLLMFYILSTRMMPPITLLIPVFIMFYYLGLKGTYIGLILIYSVMALPLAIWMIKSFIDEVPRDVDESAMLDGHTPWYILFKIILPMIAPGLAASAAFAAITIWNEFVFALVLSGIETKPTSVLLASIRGERGFNWGRVTAIEVVYILPIIILVFWLQKYILRGLTFGAVRR